MSVRAELCGGDEHDHGSSDGVLFCFVFVQMKTTTTVEIVPRCSEMSRFVETKMSTTLVISRCGEEDDNDS